MSLLCGKISLCENNAGASMTLKHRCMSDNYPLSIFKIPLSIFKKPLSIFNSLLACWYNCVTIVLYTNGILISYHSFPKLTSWLVSKDFLKSTKQQYNIFPWSQLFSIITHSIAKRLILKCFGLKPPWLSAHLWWCLIHVLILCSMIVIYNQMINGMFGQLSCIITQCNQMIDTMSIFDTISSSFSSPFFNIDTMFRHFNFYLLQPWTFWDESCILHWTKQCPPIHGKYWYLPWEWHPSVAPKLFHIFSKRFMTWLSNSLAYRLAFL